jgi:hypothetical protein
LEADDLNPCAINEIVLAADNDGVSFRQTGGNLEEAG